MNANGQHFDDVGDVRVKYDSGPSTMLQNHAALACRVALLGAPTRVRRLGSARLCAEWDLPGRVDSFTFGNPWPMDRRAVTFIEVNPAAYDLVSRWLGELRYELAGRIDVLEAALKALREANADVVTRNPDPSLGNAYTPCEDGECSICGAPQ